MVGALENRSQRPPRRTGDAEVRGQCVPALRRAAGLPPKPPARRFFLPLHPWACRSPPTKQKTDRPRVPADVSTEFLHALAQELALRTTLDALRLGLVPAV